MTKQQEKEIIRVYNAYWDNYLQGDVEAMQLLLDDEYTQVGSAEGEVFLNKKDAVQFLYDTINQVAGKLEMRNRSTILEQQGELILIHERCDLYALADGGWIFYSKFRASSLLKEKKQGWKITHQHSSFPDARADDGENIAINKIAAENLQLREAIKRRTIELEHKNRELEIEAALERVRAVAMGMQKSDDLMEICKILYSELHFLGFSELRNTLIDVFIDEESYFIDYDYSDYNGGTSNKIPYAGNPVVEKYIKKIKKSDGAFAEITVTGEQLESWKIFRRKNGEIEDIRLNDLKTLYYYKYSIGPGSIGISTYRRISKEKLNILHRFRNVFNLSYQRYTDISLAEAQAREAQIEAALERVRSRSMGMQRGTELKGVVKELYDQLRLLGFKWGVASIIIIDSDSGDFDWWMEGFEDGYDLPERYHVPYFNHNGHNQQIEHWKNGTNYAVLEISGQDKKNYDNYYFFKTDFAKAPENSKNLMMSQEAVNFSMAYMKYGALSWSPSMLDENQSTVLQRMAKVFDQTYTRFLDLQKAEAQTREAQIEVAVERVRAKALAMHKSAEIMGVAVTMRIELETLNMPGFDAATITLKQDDGTIRLWDNTSAKQHEDGTWENTEFIFRLEDNHPDFYLNKIWSSNDRYIVVEQDEHDLKITTDWVRNHDKNLADVVVHYYKENGIKQAWHPAVALTYGRLNLDFYVQAPEPEVENILIKMAAAFDLAYKRFLDLQKAEAQAREAQIEAALERVRSRTMAMQRSEELPEVAALLFQQVKALGVPQFHCGFNIFEIGDKECIWYPGSADGDILPPCKIPLTEHPVFMNFIESRKRGDELFVYEKEGEYQAGHYRYMLSLPVLGEILQNMLDAGIPFPTFQIDHLANFSHGNLLFITSEHFPEMHDTFKRFAKVFEQTYTRFLDLQKAEAQAREAQIEAALERVRAVAMSMMKSDDLLTICQSVFTQLQVLGFENIRAAQIYIRNDEEEKFMNYDYALVTGAVKVEINYNSHPNTRRIYDVIRSAGDGLVYNVIEKEKLDEWKSYLYNTLRQQPEENLNAADGLHYYLYSFGIGAFGICTFKAISPEELDILMRFRNVFNLSYQRYADIALAEAQLREAQIETSLERVRSKTMAMHNSEDVGETVATLFDELVKLGVHTNRCGILINSEETMEAEVWTAKSNPSGKANLIIGQLDLTMHPLLQGIYYAWKSKEPVFNYTMMGDDLKSYYQAINNTKYYPTQFDLDALPAKEFHTDFYFAEGSIFAFTSESIAEEASSIFKRFAKVFGQTYRRYLDLQKAELQTHKANIETALERVRARALAMQKPEELTEVAQVMRQEMGLLGVEELETSSIYIHEEGSENAECWYAIKDSKVPEKKLVSDHFKLQLNDTWVGQQMHIFYQGNKKQISIPMQGANRKEWIDYCSKQSKLLDGFYGDVIPNRTYHLYKFSNGTIGAATPGKISAESWDLLQRAASVFSLAYSRFKDLTQARIDLLKLKEEKQRAEEALTELQATQKQLIQSEKMASLGELTAGIAHEIQNPLNFVNNFSELSVDLAKELKEEVEKLEIPEKDKAYVSEIIGDLSQNQEKINHHGKRASDIVKGMLEHSRKSSGTKEPTDINALADEYLRLVYHGLKAKDKDFNATMETHFDPNLPKIDVIPQDIGRVILNLITNAFYAVSEKSKVETSKEKSRPSGSQKSASEYKPLVTITTQLMANSQHPTPKDQLLIAIKDNGSGIPDSIKDKIFQPFFTTKPTGQGTGLGLSLSYDIVKAHGGELKVETIERTGSKFIITLPFKNA